MFLNRFFLIGVVFVFLFFTEEYCYIECCYTVPPQMTAAGCYQPPKKSIANIGWSLTLPSVKIFTVASVLENLHLLERRYNGRLGDMTILKQ